MVTEHAWRYSPGPLGSRMVWCKTCEWSFLAMPDDTVGQVIEHPPGPCGGRGTGESKVPLFDEATRQSDGG